MSGGIRAAGKGNNGFGRGIAAAFGAAILGAIGWAVLTAVTNYKIGLAAVGIGLLVGLAVERFGRGDPRLPVIGAIASLFGCFLGDLLADAYVLARAVHLSIFTVISRLDQHPHLYGQLYKDRFKAFDLVFYAIAGYEGYKLSLRGVLRARASTATGYSPPAAAAQAAPWAPLGPTAPGAFVPPPFGPPVDFTPPPDYGSSANPAPGPEASSAWPPPSPPPGNPPTG